MKKKTKKDQEIKINLKGYDHALLDKNIVKVIEVAESTGAKVCGPVPLPTEKKLITVLRAVHKYKDSRDQFYKITHKRVLYILNPTSTTVGALKRVKLSAGVDIDFEL